MKTSINPMKKQIIPSTLVAVVTAGTLLLSLGAAARADGGDSERQQSAGFYQTRIGNDAPHQERNPSAHPELFQWKSASVPSATASPQLKQ
jgi:hypothetical protein